MVLITSAFTETDRLLGGAVPVKYSDGDTAARQFCSYTIDTSGCQAVPLEAEELEAVAAFGRTCPHSGWLPLCAVTLALHTIVACYVLSRSYLPSTLTVPFISMMGLLAPARWVYTIGFLFVVALWMMSSRVVWCRLQAYVGPHSRLLLLGYGSSVLAGAGLGLQGLIPMQANIVELMLEDQLAGTVTLQTTVHQSGAIIMFVTSLVHQCVMLQLYARNSKLRAALGPAAFYSLAIKGFAVAVAFATIAFSIAWHPAAGGSHTLWQLTFGAIVQWAFVSTLLLFFGSYSLDLCVLP